MSLSRTTSSRPRSLRCSAGSPSSIHLFYSNMCSMTSGFPNKIRKSKPKACAQPLTQSRTDSSPTFPGPFALGPRTCFRALPKSASPGAGVKAGRRPPVGLGLDASEDDATLPSRKQIMNQAGIRKTSRNQERSPGSGKITRIRERPAVSRKDHLDQKRSAGSRKISRTMITWKQLMIALTSAMTPALAAYDR